MNKHNLAYHSFYYPVNCRASQMGPLFSSIVAYGIQRVTKCAARQSSKLKMMCLIREKIIKGKQLCVCGGCGGMYLGASMQR